MSAKTRSRSSKPAAPLTSMVEELSTPATRWCSSTAAERFRSRTSTPRTTASLCAAAETARTTGVPATWSSRTLSPSTEEFFAASTPTTATPARSPTRARTRASTAIATRVTPVARSLARLDLGLMASTALLRELPLAVRWLIGFMSDGNDDSWRTT